MEYLDRMGSGKINVLASLLVSISKAESPLASFALFSPAFPVLTGFHISGLGPFLKKINNFHLISIQIPFFLVNKTYLEPLRTVNGFLYC